MATVFLAQDLRHDRPVALKVLHPELAHALGPERFDREVKLAARLQHPHILTVLDSGEADGHLWFTMPFVDGESLRDRLTRQRQLSVEEAVRIATEAARALDHAHRHGIIHRDIKPENILLTADGDTLVADFGIARAFTGDQDRLTETGLTVGTPAYMSPEQAAGARDLDARTGVYALGAVLYEMLAGAPPFTGATPQEVIAKRFKSEAPRVREARPAVPEHLDQAVAKALASLPADRFATAAELVKELASGPAPAPTVGMVAAPATRATARRRVPAGFTLLLVGFLVGVGALFAWRGGNSHGAGAGPRVIAVLPFENQGDTAQAFFADAITDEVRGKLTALPGLQVIAGASSNEYRGNAKPLEKIASELGADYLLVAKVRWAQGPNGTRLVRVSPELVAFRAGKPTSQWQQTFDAALTDVFKVQADIAGQVANALDLALTDSVTHNLAAKPTGNLPAYEAFLRAEQIGNQDFSIPGQRQSLVYYRQAVALDSGFALAWAQMSRTLSFLYTLGATTPEMVTQARAAADRAMALAPTLPQSHLAEVGYAINVLKDAERAVAAVRSGLAVAPNDPDLISRMGTSLGTSGQWDSARVYQQQAARLDPRSWAIAAQLSATLRYLHQYPEALREVRRARSLNSTPGPSLFQSEVTTLLGMGDLAAARSTLQAAATQIELSALVSFIATFGDLFWVLDDGQQQLLLTLSPAEFGDERANWGLALAETWWLRGDRARAAAYADSAGIAFEERLRGGPDAERRVLLGLTHAYAGRKAEALRMADAALAELPRGQQQSALGAYVRHQRARTFVLTGEHAKAVDELDRLLKMPYDLSPAWLRIDPNFAALKGNPGFERLITGGS